MRSVSLPSACMHILSLSLELIPFMVIVGGWASNRDVVDKF